MLVKNYNLLKVILNKKDKKNIFLFFFSSALVTILETVGVGILPIFIAYIIDKKNIINQLEKFNLNFQNIEFFLNSENFLLFSLIGIAIFFALKNSYLFLHYFYEAKIFNNLKSSLSNKLIKNYLSRNLIFHLNNNPIILTRNLTGEIYITVAYIRSMILILREILQTFFIFLILISVNVKITLIITLILFIFYFFVFNTFSRKIDKYAKVALIHRGEKGKIINQILNSISDIKLYSKSKLFVEKFIFSLTQELNAQKFFEIINRIPRILIEVLIVFLFLIYIYYNLNSGNNLQDIIPILVLYTMAALRIYPSFNNILMNRMDLVKSSVSINHIFNELNNKENVEQEILFEKNLKFEDKIDIIDLNFSYKNKKKIINNINITIKKNQIVGILGESGTGKSTLIKIIMGLIKPDNGKILIDGIEMDKVKNEWQKKIAYLDQKFYLLDDTILENITFGDPKEKVDFDKLNYALKMSNLDSFVNSLEKKIYTIIGNDGKRISGGQGQRVGLARAFYHESEVMILDEATSALDSKTENEIINEIYNLKNKKTIILISHNKEILNKCDQLIDLNNIQ